MSRIRVTRVLEGHACGLGGLGEETGVGEAGDRVRLEDPGAVGGEDHVRRGAKPSQPSARQVARAASVTAARSVGERSAGQTKRVRPIS